MTIPAVFTKLSVAIGAALSPRGRIRQRLKLGMGIHAPGFFRIDGWEEGQQDNIATPLFLARNGGLIVQPIL